MSALTKVGNIIRCGWLRYLPQDDEEAYDELLVHRAARQKKQGNVADAVAMFEDKSKLPTDVKVQEKKKAQDLDVTNDTETCAQKALSGATLLLGIFTGSIKKNGGKDGSASQNKESESTTTTTSSSRASIRKIRPSSDTKCCACCLKTIFPMDESTSCRHNNYHTACFRCSLCGSKLKNHPDEEHEIMAETKRMFLQCRQCKIDNEHKCKPRQLSRVAGEKIVVEDEEQGDIEQVVDAIGDDLEDAICAMIPRCATCGGDFLSYKGEVSIVGSLKYHQECFLTGKPGAGSAPSLTLDAIQAAKYLPDNIILKLSSTESCRAITTLFFVWKDKEKEFRSMRSDSTRQGNRLSVSFDLDEEARANPNFKGTKNSPKKTTAPLSLSDNGDHSDLILEIIGGDQVAPQPPKLIEPISVVHDYQKASYLQATLGYSKYNLDHSLILAIPCSLTGDVLELLGATLTVTIQERDS